MSGLVFPVVLTRQGKKQRDQARKQMKQWLGLVSSLGLPVFCSPNDIEEADILRKKVGKAAATVTPEITADFCCHFAEAKTEIQFDFLVLFAESGNVS